MRHGSLRRAAAVMIVALAVAAFFTPAAVASMTKDDPGLMEDKSAQIAAVLAERLGLALDPEFVPRLLTLNQPVTGRADDPAKLAARGLDGLKPGDEVELINLGRDELRLRHLATGKPVTLAISQIFGLLGLLFD